MLGEFYKMVTENERLSGLKMNYTSKAVYEGNDKVRMNKFIVERTNQSFDGTKTKPSQAAITSNNSLYHIENFLESPLKKSKSVVKNSLMNKANNRYVIFNVK